MISGYSGNLFRLRRASDNATLDVACATGSDLPDYAAIDTWRAGSDTFVALIYDQLSAAASLTQATAANQPRFDTAQSARYAGGAPFLLGEYGSDPSMLATGFTLSRQNISYLAVGECIAPAQTNPLMDINDGTTLQQGFYPSGGSGRMSVFETAATNATVSAWLRSNPSVVGFTSTAAERRFFFRETNEAVAAGAAGAATGLRIGVNPTITNNPSWKIWCVAIYPALSTGDMTTLIASAALAASIQTTFDRRIVFCGDSLAIGHQYAKYLRTAGGYYLFGSLAGSPEIVNRGIGGTTLATADTNYSSTSSASAIARFYTASYGAGKCALVIQRATNDLAAGTTAAAAYTSASSIITKAKATGFLVGICPIISRGDAAYTAPVQAERVSYNSAVSGNAGGADFIVPLTGDAVLGDPVGYNNTTYYNGDKVHLLDAGYALAGPIYVSALNAALP